MGMPKLSMVRSALGAAALADLKSVEGRGVGIGEAT